MKCESFVTLLKVQNKEFLGREGTKEAGNTIAFKSARVLDQDANIFDITVDKSLGDSLDKVANVEGTASLNLYVTREGKAKLRLLGFDVS